MYVLYEVILTRKLLSLSSYTYTKANLTMNNTNISVVKKNLYQVLCSKSKFKLIYNLANKYYSSVEKLFLVCKEKVLLKRASKLMDSTFCGTKSKFSTKIS